MYCAEMCGGGVENVKICVNGTLADWPVNEGLDEGTTY